MDAVKISVGKWEGIASLGRHHPKLMPRPAEIRRVHNSFAVWRRIRSRLPGSFFIMYFVRFGARFRLHAPETTRPINVPAVRNENQFRTVRRPCRADLVIELTVVIARQFASIFSCEALHIS